MKLVEANLYLENSFKKEPTCAHDCSCNTRRCPDTGHYEIRAKQADRDRKSW